MALSRNRKEPLPRRHCCRPCLEALEVRDLLSTFLVDRLTDANPPAGGEGSGLAGDLRYCINQANSIASDGMITFGVSGTINLHSGLAKLSSRGRPPPRPWKCPGPAR